jgi:hypothetical protein
MRGPTNEAGRLILDWDNSNNDAPNNANDVADNDADDDADDDVDNDGNNDKQGLSDEDELE